MRHGTKWKINSLKLDTALQPSMQMGPTHVLELKEDI